MQRHLDLSVISNKFIVIDSESNTYIDLIHPWVYGLLLAIRKVFHRLVCVTEIKVTNSSREKPLVEQEKGDAVMLHLSFLWDQWCEQEPGGLAFCF